MSKRSTGKGERDPSIVELPSVEELSAMASAPAAAPLRGEPKTPIHVLKKTLDFSRALSSILDVEELLGSLIERFIEFMEAERGFLILLDEQGNTHFEMCRNLEGGDIEDPDEQVSTAVIEEAIRSGRAILVPNAMTHPGFRDRPSITRLELVSVLCAPLLGSRKGVLGAIYLDNRSKAGRFDEQDRDMLALLAGQAGTALENARLVEELMAARSDVGQGERLVLAGQIGQRVNSLFRGVLAKIIGHAQIVNWSDSSETAAGGLKGIENEAKLGLSVLQKLDEISSSGAPKRREALGLRGLIESCLSELPIAAVKCRVDIGGEVTVLGNRHQLRTVIQEVLANAWEAARDVEGGAIEVSSTTDAGSALIRIEDNGAGMGKEAAERAREPFFTTRREALGLGLCVAEASVRAHGGTLDIGPRAGGGTLVRIRLPLGEEEEWGPQAAPRPSRATGRILLVEDEVEVADILARTLAGQGNTVQVAPFPEEAVEYLRRDSWEILMLAVGFPKSEVEMVVRASHSVELRPTTVLLAAWGQRPHASHVPGIDMTATKPIQLRLLPSLVQRALREYECRNISAAALP